MLPSALYAAGTLVYPSRDAHYVSQYPLNTSRNKGHLDIATEVEDFSNLLRNYTNDKTRASRKTRD
jgi:hypothetical protein